MSELKVLEVKAIERQVKEGKEKGKKFMAFKVFNKKTGYYEELRFNQSVTNKPVKEGTYTVNVQSTEINRIGTDQRKFPLTWVSKVESFTEYERESNQEGTEKDLPF